MVTFSNRHFRFKCVHIAFYIFQIYNRLATLLVIALV